MFIGILALVLMIHVFVSKIFKTSIEGLTNASGAVSETSTAASNGVAVNSTGYSAILANEVTRMHDVLHMDKYKESYRTIIEEQAELLKMHMLELALHHDPSNVQGNVQELQLMNDLSKALTSLDLLHSYLQ
jgi:hypothetical protein